MAPDTLACCNAARLVYSSVVATTVITAARHCPTTRPSLAAVWFLAMDVNTEMASRPPPGARAIVAACFDVPQATLCHIYRRASARRQLTARSPLLPAILAARGSMYLALYRITATSAVSGSTRWHCCRRAIGCHSAAMCQPAQWPLSPRVCLASVPLNLAWS